MFAVVICLNIFEETHIGPHSFTQYEIVKLRALLLSLLVKDRIERYHGIQAIFDYLAAPMPSFLPHQGIIPRSPLGGVELPHTIKLIAGGLLVGTISFKPARYYRQPLYGNSFDSSSSEDEDDPEIASVTANNIEDDNQHISQYSETSDDGDSSSYGIEDARTPSNMGTDKQMEETVVAGSEEDSGATIPAETVLDSNTVYDWKIQYTGSMKKVEDKLNKEVHIPIAKQPTTVKEKSTATMQMTASTLREKVIPGVDHSVDFPSTYDVEELDASNNSTITAFHESAYHPTDEE